MDYNKIIKKAIDLHVHVGPEIIPRKFILPELLKEEANKLGGVGVKNHFFPIIGDTKRSAIKPGCPLVISSITLNHYVGGFNAAAVRCLAEISANPIIVWFPTIHSENILKNQKFEIPGEWIDVETRKQFKFRPTKFIKGLKIFDEKMKISREVKEVLVEIKKSDAILATGHISWQESQSLVKFAVNKIGLKKIIITHPIYQKIDMPIDIQKKLTKLGALVEHCFSMYSIDKISIKKIVEQIKFVGAANCILSSDVGQIFSLTPSEALKQFVKLLKKEGINENEIKIMLIKNPRRLIGKSD